MLYAQVVMSTKGHAVFHQHNSVQACLCQSRVFSLPVVDRDTNRTKAQQTSKYSTVHVGDAWPSVAHAVPMSTWLPHVLTGVLRLEKHGMQEGICLNNPGSKHYGVMLDFQLTLLKEERLHGVKWCRNFGRRCQGVSQIKSRCGVWPVLGMMTEMPVVQA